MASKQRYRKLSLGPSDRVTSKNSHVGMSVIADYIESGQRYLVFERASAESPKKAAPRAKSNAKAASSQATAFPGTVVANG
jgi:hypothetical protein